MCRLKILKRYYNVISDSPIPPCCLSCLCARFGSEENSEPCRISIPRSSSQTEFFTVFCNYNMILLSPNHLIIILLYINNNFIYWRGSLFLCYTSAIYQYYSTLLHSIWKIPHHPRLIFNLKPYHSGTHRAFIVFRAVASFRGAIDTCKEG